MSAARPAEGEAELPVLQADGIVKSFAGLPVLKGFELVLRRGEMFALIGPNGSGKSTFIDLACGVLAPDAGSIRICGRQAVGLAAWRVARLGVGRCHQESRLWSELSAAEHMQVVAESQLAASARPTAVDFAEWAGFPRALLQHRPEALPLLQRRRLELAMAASVGSQLLMLDELGAGLHVEEAHALFDCVSAWLRQGHVGAVLVVEHRLELVADRASAAGLVHDGRLLQAPRSDRSAFDQVLQGLFLEPTRINKEFVHA